MRRILTMDNPEDEKLLRRKTKYVKDFNHPEIIIMKQEMAKIAKQPHCAGLAANQIGYPWRVFVIHLDKNASPVWFFNPRIVKYGKVIKDQPEGCLSVENKAGIVPRSTTIDGTWQNEWGKKMGSINDKKELVPKKFDGFVAQVWQHETDHLNNILYIDKAKSIKDVVADDLPNIEVNDKIKEMVEKVNLDV